jgi:hypothetical protein
MIYAAKRIYFSLSSTMNWYSKIPNKSIVLTIKIVQLMTYFQGMEIKLNVEGFSNYNQTLIHKLYV